MSEMNIGNRLDSYITNVSAFLNHHFLTRYFYFLQFTMPWEKKKQKNASNNNEVYSTVGGVVMYKMKLTKNSDGVVEGW